MLACEACGVEQPMGEMLDVNGRTLCTTCAEAFVAERNSTEGVKWHVDSTICANCGADGDRLPHSQLCGLPACAACIDFYRNRPFPTWVKAFFATVLIFVIVSLVWNWRFFQGYFEIKAARAAMNNRDSDQAAAHMIAAAKYLPEVEYIPAHVDFYQGLAFLNRGRLQEAKDCLERCRPFLPEANVEKYLQYVAAAAAYNQKDYDAVASILRETGSSRTKRRRTCAQVAAVYACKHAVHGDQESRNTAEAKLKEAKRLAGRAIWFESEELRIRHRLETREIIDINEYTRRFPNGWKPSVKPKT